MINRYNKTALESGQFNAIHLKELEQALNSAGYNVRDFTETRQCLALGRSLSKYNHTYDFQQANGEFRQNIQFSAQTKSLLWHNQVCHQRTIQITASDIEVMK